MRLLRALVPGDPPVRPLMHEFSAVIRILLTSGTVSGITDYGSLGKPAIAAVKTGDRLTMKLNHVQKLIMGFMGYRDDTSFEIDIRRVSLWGPVSGDSAPILSMDVSDISGGLIVTDKCGKNHCARMGISSPFNLWQKPNGTRFIVCDPAGSTEQELGVLDLSVSWRRFAL